MPQITIIGAGPAGSAAALLLARRGWDATLIEQHRFPRDKVCGECLSALGVEALQRIGLMPGLLQAGAVWLHRTIVHGREGRPAAIHLERPMLGISRAALDGLLLDAAGDSGARIRQPARCEAIVSTPRVRDRFGGLSFSLSRYSGGSERNRRLPASGPGWGSLFLGPRGANPHPNP
ncbi:MAG TPA: FAD-dependent oxidoreductase, partial [Tepidisphaeraceae bacterium]|nr:FAD-dependent oxidoreductase [Tepidisphaeraceae bacterium]